MCIVLGLCFANRPCDSPDGSSSWSVKKLGRFSVTPFTVSPSSLSVAKIHLCTRTAKAAIGCPACICWTSHSAGGSTQRSKSASTRMSRQQWTCARCLEDPGLKCKLRSDTHCMRIYTHAITCNDPRWYLPCAPAPTFSHNLFSLSFRNPLSTLGVTLMISIFQSLMFVVSQKLSESMSSRGFEAKQLCVTSPCSASPTLLSKYLCQSVVVVRAGCVGSPARKVRAITIHVSISSRVGALSWVTQSGGRGRLFARHSEGPFIGASCWYAESGDTDTPARSRILQGDADLLH